MPTLYVKVTWDDKNKKRCANFVAIQMPDDMFERLEDENAESLLDFVAEHAKNTFSDCDEVTGCEFISGQEFSYYSNLARANGTKKGQALYNIFVKLIGLVPEDKQGIVPAIPFKMPSRKPLEELTEQEKEQLRASILGICQNRFGKTPDEIVFIDRTEFEELVEKIKGSSSDLDKPANQ